MKKLILIPLVLWMMGLSQAVSADVWNIYPNDTMIQVIRSDESSVCVFGKPAVKAVCWIAKKETAQPLKDPSGLEVIRYEARIFQHPSDTPPKGFKGASTEKSI